MLPLHYCNARLYLFTPVGFEPLYRNLGASNETRTRFSDLEGRGTTYIPCSQKLFQLERFIFSGLVSGLGCCVNYSRRLQANINNGAADGIRIRAPTLARSCTTTILQPHGGPRCFHPRPLVRTVGIEPTNYRFMRPTPIRWASHGKLVAGVGI